VLIAVPNCQGRVSPVFDVAARLTLVHLEGEGELGPKEAVLYEKQLDQIVRCLVDIGVEVLVCAAISDRLEAGLVRAGIRVVSQICGPVEAVIAAYRMGTLDSPEFMMPGCYGRRWEAGRRGGKCRKDSNSSHSIHRATQE
jgi:predicted Fe-Mo cluster-binding NifX family protein